jgi:glucosamine--fructose-6-phosphate aminotransferase (isomerizing)
MKYSETLKLKISKINYYIEKLNHLPNDIKNTLDSVLDETKNVVNYLEHQSKLFILGKGQLIHCALEGSLKIKEIGYIHAEAYGGNSLRHGPYAIIDDGMPIILLCPNDENFALMNNTCEEIKSRNAFPIIISDLDYQFRCTSHKIIVQNNTVYKGILHNIPMQLIAYYLAVKKGHNPDMPKNLSKCVSV